MSKSNTFENDFLKLIFWGTAIADIAENDTTSPLTQYYLALHIADPTDAGVGSTSECAYTGYTRKAVNRDNTVFSITNDTVTFAANQDFPAKSGGADETATHFSITVASSGASKILYHGTISPNISIVNGTVPRLTTGTTIVEN